MYKTNIKSYNFLEKTIRNCYNIIGGRNMDKERNIPFKNYVLLALTLIITILIVIYFFVWYGYKEENNLKVSIMDKYLMVINYNELDNFLVENKDAIIYISKLNDKETRVFEKKFKLLVNDYSLNNDILYLDITDIDNFKLEDKNIEVPSIIMYENGKIDNIYNVKKNNYNIDLLKEYLEEEGIIDND